MNSFKKFNPDLSDLSSKEREVLDKLVRAAEIIGGLYERQKNKGFKGSNFYPKDTTEEEVRKAAEKDPKILHPYTFVERDKKGNLKAVFFTQKFKKELKQAAKLIREGAKISEDRNFSDYLHKQAKALLSNNYAENETLWVTHGPFKINFIIGPIERYLDRLFFRKCAYQSWVGVLNEERTREIKRFKQIILAGRRKVLVNTEKISLGKLRVDTNRTVCFSGLIKDQMFTGTNLPNSMELMEEYGSRLTIFEDSLRNNFREEHLPILKKFFEKSILEEYNKEELYEATLRCIVLHEITHSLIRYKDAEDRLGSLFPVFDEVLAYILGLKSCDSLLLKGAINQKEFEAVLLLYLVRHFAWWENYKKRPSVEDYARGGAIAANFFLKEGGLEKENGQWRIDFTKLFMSISHLAQILEYYISSGEREEAAKFVEKYGPFDVFENFTES